MNKFVKYALMGFGGIFAIYLPYHLIKTYINDSIRAAELIEAKANNDRIDAIQLKLADSFAACTTSSLKPQYLQEFIVHQVMPLGIAWQSANQVDGLRSNAYQLLSKHISDSNYYEFGEHLHLKLKHHLNRANGIESKFDSSALPSIFVYKLAKTTRFKNTKPSEIEIGSMDFLWPKFKALAVRCKATPYDLDQLIRNQSLSPEHMTEDEVEAARVSSMEYFSFDPLILKQKHMYWQSLTLTPEYKAIYAKIKANNLLIMNAIMTEHESKDLEEKKQANDEMFMKP